MKIRIALLFLLLAFCFTLLGEDSKTTIKILVTNQYDKPVDNAAVILDFLGSRQITKVGRKKRVHWEVHTNQEGRAHFPPVPEGTIQLQVHKLRYQTFGKNVDVAGAEQLVEIKLEPPQSQYSTHEPLKPKDSK
ncbi:MAG TPA: carboxypeptidase-like regulatory domain-containing protein [Bryobacteraceae bacterium]|nr:carboxypeptidase-like regulatory domain-containing protein [Bryobacteraceae bacterium]